MWREAPGLTGPMLGRTLYLSGVVVFNCKGGGRVKGKNNMNFLVLNIIGIADEYTGHYAL